jgi:hypothetical protein
MEKGIFNPQKDFRNGSSTFYGGASKKEKSQVLNGEIQSCENSCSATRIEKYLYCAPA